MSDQQQTVVNVNLTAPTPASGAILLDVKSTGTALLFWFFLGGFGGHRFYLNRPHAKTMLILNLVGWATVLLIVGIPILGAVAIWALVDAFSLSKWVREHNAGLTLGAAGTAPVPAEPAKPKDLQTMLLQEAERQNGRLTVTQAVKGTGKSFDEVEKCLQEMVASGYVDVDNKPGSGVVVYVFDEMV